MDKFKLDATENLQVVHVYMKIPDLSRLQVHVLYCLFLVSLYFD